MKAEEVLLELWRELRDGCTVEREGEFIAVLHAFVKTEDITLKQALFYGRAIKACPGHEDKGGREWCAYCGNLNVSNGTGNTITQRKVVPADGSTMFPIRAEDAIAG